MPRSRFLPLSLRPAALLLLAATASAAEPSPADTSPWSLHAQSTVVEQWHDSLTSAYSGLNSLSGRHEDKHTATLTLFLGHTLWTGGELYYNPEMSQGTGLSDSVGMAGFPNGEATRAGAKVAQYNTARLFLRHTFGFGGEREKVESGQNQVAGERDINRLTLTLGKMSASDSFDGNAFSHDPRTQFLNWALMANGAWDYPADVKGYTGGFTAEWNQATRTLRWGAFMEPVAANERQLDKHLGKALGQAFEWEERYTLAGHPGAVRALAYWNRAHMGNYAIAVQSRAPDVTLSRAYRSKAGLGLNWQQELAPDFGVFARAGFNDGHAETWAFTEIDRTLSVGASLKGTRWGRTADTIGLALLGNGLSGEHRRYLAAGGYGFIVGDGHLSYKPEQIMETYYDWKPAPWLALALNYQFAAHPGYNAARGPASLFAVRTHVEF